MTGEEVKKFTFDFEHSGSYVLVWLVDDISEDPSDSSVIGIYLEGTDLTIDSFDENNYAELDDIERGQYSLTVIPSNPDAKVYVDGELAENGVYDFKFYALHEYKIRVVSPDGNSTVEYKLKLNAKPTGRNTDTDVSIPVTYCTLTFETNGGDYIRPLRKICKTVVDLDKYVPECDGYEFTGWYTDSALTNGVTKVRLTRNMKVYAGWEKISAMKKSSKNTSSRSLTYMTGTGSTPMLLTWLKTDSCAEQAATSSARIPRPQEQ